MCLQQNREERVRRPASLALSFVCRLYRGSLVLFRYNGNCRTTELLCRPVFFITAHAQTCGTHQKGGNIAERSCHNGADLKILDIDAYVAAHGAEAEKNRKLFISSDHLQDTTDSGPFRSPKGGGLIHCWSVIEAAETGEGCRTARAFGFTVDVKVEKLVFSLSDPLRLFWWDWVYWGWVPDKIKPKEQWREVKT